MAELIRESYRYRELIWALALKELKIRYKRSVLGFHVGVAESGVADVGLDTGFSAASCASLSRITPFSC